MIPGPHTVLRDRFVKYVQEAYPHIKLSHQRCRAWEHDMEKMLKRGHLLGDIYQVLDFLERNAGGDYAFVVQSTKSLAAKWDRIVTAMERSKRVRPTGEARSAESAGRAAAKKLLFESDRYDLEPF